MHDVIVIGGGPAGSRVAFRLAEKGHSVLVLERKAALGDKCCTGIIGRECAEAFDINEKVILKQVNSAVLHSPCGERLHVRRAEIQACILDRGDFDISLADKARRSGAEYRFESWAKAVTPGVDKTIVTVFCGGEEEKIQAKCVVAACGFAPGLVRGLGLGFFPDVCYGAQAEIDAPGLQEVEVYLGGMAPDFFAWLVPVTGSNARAGLLTRHKPGEYLKNWLAELESQGKIATANVKTRYGVIPLKPPAHTFGERLIAVGDAAGQVKPMSGGGIYYGLICADVAADTLHRALIDGDLSAARLAQYEIAWRIKPGREMRAGYRARKLFERLSDGNIDWLFRIARACGIEEAVTSAPGVSFDWHGKTVKEVVKYRLRHPGRRK